MDFEPYLKKNIQCACGHVHRCEIEDIVVGKGVLKELPRLLEKCAYEHICIIEDENTKFALGDEVERITKEAGYEVSSIVLPGSHLLPDEAGLGAIVTELPSKCDLILAVGSGTINDLGKMISSKIHVPFFIIGTAASMDGFASNVSAMVTKKAKVTYETCEPRAIIADTEVMAKAPLDLISAGVGDVLGKYVCLTDWKISNLLTGEYYCEYVADLIKESVEKVKHAAEILATKRDVQCIEELVDGLILSGIAMSYIGNSRPASGSEHHLSHFWEMHFLQFGEHGAYHGTKVGVGTVLCLKLYEWLAEEKLDESILVDYQFDKEAWEQEICRVYKSAAPEVIVLENEVHKNAEDNRRSRMEQLLVHQDEIQDLIAALPKAEEIKELLENLEGPVYPSQIEVTDDRITDGILYAKDLRNRTGLLQILYDLGLSKKYGERAIKEFCK